VPRRNRIASFVLVVCLLFLVGSPAMVSASVSDSDATGTDSAWYTTLSFEGLWSWFQSIVAPEKGQIVP
jgi:hypothetical protein